jgi:hypothetical protein
VAAPGESLAADRLSVNDRGWFPRLSDLIVHQNHFREHALRRFTEAACVLGTARDPPA